VFEPVLICKMPGDFTEAVSALGVECHYVEEMERSIKPWADLRAIFKLYNVFRKIRPDVVHTHSSKTGVLGRIAAKFAGVPAVIHTVHGFPFDSAENVVQRWFYVGLEWVSAQFCDAMVLLKNADLEFSHRTLQVPRNKLHLIPNGVAMNGFEPMTRQFRKLNRTRLLGCPADETCIAMTGRLWEQKNPECFVNAAITVLKTGVTNTSFYLIGDGPLRPMLQEMIDLSGFSEKIKILGWRNDVPVLLQVMDVFVLPSRWEGLSLAILEAMASGLPVVASDIPGNTDLVDDGVTGYQFKGEVPSSLAEKLLLLIADPEKRAAMGNRGRTTVDQHYRIESRVKTMEELYVQLLRSSAGFEPVTAKNFQNEGVGGRTGTR
jgi:glycosyltransferase involved in cell wall biosynthesis